MVSSLVTIIIWLLIIGVVFGLLLWLVDFIPVPEPFNRVIKVVAAVGAVIIVIVMLLQFAGMITPVHLP